MTNIYTKRTPVTGEVDVWAIPNPYAEEGELPFKYELRLDKPWQTGAVRVTSESITITVPAGINLIAKAVETLKEAKEDAHESYVRETQRLDERIQHLLMLTGPTVGGDSDQEGGISVLEGEIG